MTALTKADLAARLVEEVGLNNREAKAFIDQFFGDISMALERGETVKIPTFGNFVLRDKKARPGRNPKTGEDKIIKARRVATFRTSQKLKNEIQENVSE